MGLISKLRAGTALVSAFMGVAIAAPAFAQDGAGQGSEIDLASAFELPPIITSASRLSAGLSSSSVTVVEREAIDRHPGLTIPEILATEAGLHIRDLFGNGNESATVDIRGFGEQAGQNVLVLVDGRKINDLDLSGVQFSLVPRASIQRIEVLRGKIEFESGEEGRELEILEHLLRKSVADTVRAHLGGIDMAPLVGALEEGEPVVTGDRVTAGQPVMTLEAMKMENPVKAHKAGAVTGLAAEVGGQVNKGAVLMELK